MLLLTIQVMHKRFQEIHESSANWFATWRSFVWFYIGFYKWKWHKWKQTQISFAVNSHGISMDAESTIIGFTHSASFWIIYLIFISNIKNKVLSIIRSLQDTELESFTVICTIETPFCSWTKWCLCYARDSIPHQNVYNVSESRHIMMLM